jgi:hypothetical protein
MDVNLLGQPKSSSVADSENHLLQKIWHKSAPGAVRKAYRLGKESEAWSAWRKHLARRARPLPLWELLPGKSSPLAWGLPDEMDAGRFGRLLEQVEPLWTGDGSRPSSVETEVLTWLADAAGSAPGAGYALEALVWCHALPQLAGKLPPELWWDLLEHLRGAAAEAEAIDLDQDPLAHQLLAGELPLALSYLVGVIAPCRKLGRRARRALSTGLVELLDGEGLPHAEQMAMLRPLLACWTRCRAIGNEADKGCWSKAAQNQYEWLVRQALRLARPDGSQVLSPGQGGAWCKALFDAAMRLGGDDDDQRIAALVLPRPAKAKNRQIRKRGLPKPGVHSEWSAAAVLSSGWEADDPRLAVLYPDRSVRLELHCRGELLWTGAWELEIRRDGREVRPRGPWEEVCWVSDADADYLELEMPFDEGLSVQRQMLLAKEDGLLLLADAILGDRPASLEYRGCLPLAEKASFRPAEETREGYVKGRRRLALALPLALPEWRADDRGSLEQTERGLELRQRGQGRAMLAPLCFDLRPRRMTRRFTWRKLTVAEDLEIQPDDVAVGYRVRLGKDQWLFYRALASKGNRTLLGHNLTSETLLARFDRSGEVEPLVEIE